MSELDELYQEVILDHNRRPRNHEALPAPARSGEGFNPLCGDRIRVYLELDGDTVKRVTFEGNGCAISQASASVMTEAVKGKTVEEVEALFHSFQDLVTGKAEADPIELGEIGALVGVRTFPTRVKCATLAWHTLHSLLQGRNEPVSTEGEGA